MKSKTLNSISTIYMIVGILIMLGADQFGLSILTIICFIAAWYYSEQAKETEKKETILSNQLYEGTGND